MKYILLISLIFLAPAAQAQFGKKLADRAKEAAERKANQKADEALNKGVDKIDSVITGKKRDGKQKEKDTVTTTSPTEENNTGNTTEPEEASSPQQSGEGVADENGEFIIKTNIKCAAGKTHIETLIRETDGVNSVTINAATGKLYLTAGSSSTVYSTAIEIINANGFEADGKKPANTKNKTCK